MNLNRDLQLQFASNMLKIKGFSPDIIADKLYLECWNDDLTESCHFNIGDEEIEFYAEQYLNVLNALNS